jgi:hypothetical protein
LLPTREIPYELLPMEFFVVLLISLQLLISLEAFASSEPPSQADLRYRLETLYNEVDLLIRNQRSDESGRARVERAFSALRVLDRIPTEPRVATLRAELTHRAREAGLKLVKLEVLSMDQPQRPVPREIFSDTPRFRLEPDQIAQTLHLRLTLAGDGSLVEQWIQKWPEDQLRLIEPEHGYTRPGLKPLGKTQFQIRARAFRFRNIRFPTLKPRDPMELLPDAARRDPAAFAASEPELWTYVRRIREKIPQTPKPFEIKGDLLLGEARMNFFLSKAK